MRSAAANRCWCCWCSRCVCFREPCVRATQANAPSCAPPSICLSLFSFGSAAAKMPRRSPQAVVANGMPGWSLGPVCRTGLAGSQGRRTDEKGEQASGKELFPHGESCAGRMTARGSVSACGMLGACSVRVSATGLRGKAPGTFRHRDRLPPHSPRTRVWQSPTCASGRARPCRRRNGIPSRVRTDAGGAGSRTARKAEAACGMRPKADAKAVLSAAGCESGELTLPAITALRAATSSSIGWLLRAQGCACPVPPLLELHPRVHRQRHDRRPGRDRADPPGCFDATDFGHLHAEDNDVGPQRRDAPDGLHAVCRLTGHRPARLLRQRRRQSRAEPHPRPILCLALQVLRPSDVGNVGRREDRRRKRGLRIGKVDLLASGIGWRNGGERLETSAFRRLLGVGPRKFGPNVDADTQRRAHLVGTVLRRAARSV
ncbi:MAG: hypothetical protein FAZ92_03057 [Accumulibacter sp.]|nr:MAG: hypothetical protein FAZ92_03057 [Accumulibacter sp.]